MGLSCGGTSSILPHLILAHVNGKRVTGQNPDFRELELMLLSFHAWSIPTPLLVPTGLPPGNAADPQYTSLLVGISPYSYRGAS